MTADRDRPRADPALPAITAPPGAPDWAGLSFSVLERLGERVAITFGRVRGAEVEWVDVPHATFDGVGGLAHVLRARGLRVDRLPTLARPGRPGLLRRLWALCKDPTGDKLPPVAWKTFDPTRRPGGAAARPAFRLLSAERSARLAAETPGASANSVLLAALDRALAPRLVAGEAPSTWMVPVNMRGGVSLPRDTQNTSAYLPVRVRRGATAQDVHTEVKALLAGHAHWAVWLLVGLARWSSSGTFAKLITKYYERPGHPFVGAFSNLGEWPLDSAPEDDADGWVFTPPVLKTIPLAAGALTWRGRLGLALRAHPALTEDPAEVEAWLAAWVEALGG